MVNIRSGWWLPMKPPIRRIARLRPSWSVRRSGWIIPPVIQTISQQVDGRTAVIRFQALSKVSPLDRAEVSTGEDHWKEILSDDGIVDSQRETFTLRLQGLPPGEHVISLRAYDTAGNIGIGKAVIEVR